MFVRKNIVFFSSISPVRISYITIWLKTWSWYKNPLKNEIWKGLNWYFPKDAIWRGSVRSDLKNSTPSPWKRWKTTSSATFCATGVWGLRNANIKKQSRNKIWLHQQKERNVLDSFTMCQVFTRGSYLNKNVKPASSCDVFFHICERF